MTASFEQSSPGTTPSPLETPIPLQPVQSLPDLSLATERANQIANQLVRDEHAAADIAQRVVIGYWQRYVRNGPPTDPAAYLGTSVRNGVASYGRSVQRTIKHETSLDEIAEFSEAAESLPMLRDRGTPVPEQVTARETLDEITGYWPLLTEQQRNFLNMAIDGSQPAEIAERYGVNANLVSACLVRARQTLRTLVKLSALDAEELATLMNNEKTDKTLVRLYRRKQLLDKHRQQYGTNY